eukprot:GHVO01064759.1.p1 GENE.GHVO01064759.1~~GHVO01064759.1.p1  ORF type:complete len:215 (+),score=5.59 GHVO01064759.1:637-1281(+)
MNLYCSQSACVKWSDCKSRVFEVKNGVKQGGVLSPIMFIMYLDVLMKRLEASSVGCHVASVFCGAFAYADDVVLLAPSLPGLQNMLEICSRYASDYEVIFNSTKSKVIVINNGGRTVAPIRFMGGNIKIVLNDKHLGIILGNVTQQQRVSKLTNEIMSKTNMLKYHFKNLPIDPLYTLFRSHCMPLYGSQLIDLSHASVNRLYITWRKSIHFFV